MKILFHINSMGRGGAEHVVSILGSHFVQGGNEVVLTTEWTAQQEYPVDGHIRRIPVGLSAQDEKKGRFTKIWLRYARLRKCIRQEKPDIVISFCNKANFRSAFAMLGMRIPLLVSVRNDPQTDYAPYKIPAKIMEKKAAGCVFQTPDAMKFFSERFQEKSCIIFNPLSDEYCGQEEPAEELAEELAIEAGQERRKEIVTVGRISRQKNQKLLICAFQNILQRYPDYTLKIYGDVQEEDLYLELKQYIAENGLQGKVLFMGVADSLWKVLPGASVFVLPSDYEGMPNTLIEAMALGLPCIATDCPCGGAAMLIENNVSGILIPAGDREALQEALCAVLGDSARAGSMGSNAKNILEKVHPDKICDEWMAFIKETVKRQHK